MAQPVVQTIHRDPSLFYWILVPITVVMILTGILRHYAMILLQSAPKKQGVKDIRQTRSLMRGVNLRNNASVLTRPSFESRKNYLVPAYQDGTFLAEPEKRGQPRANPMSDPAAMEGMMGMMKNQVVMMVPQTLIMGWINAFFSGFVILKLPFPLTPQFKSMLQSGVGTRDLDVRWVSSLSFYFLCLFGLQPVYNFILGSNNSASQVSQQMAQMNPGAGITAMDPNQDPDKLFLSEAENLEVTELRSILEGIEGRILEQLR
ncbi:transmembrane protein [Eremomyces bilateralis CBS 781.70]|uniref:ER membrane protein complex subunit 3 n=1 Tax=Eremomyces bilateralis CBS 781.70 TaxID=1392243 RepID=A0A6G1GHN2_9PEZI|nr:uncharacterized protein P152DRAFT_24605 [Eremomyces bilateralis CBS 781.70]KAF1817607.1 transmembrane protein [Eremomyces bilateralis CBS 781.70]